MIPYAPPLIPCAATQIDTITGSVNNSLNPSSGFCGARAHQRINGTFSVFSAAFPAVLAVSASDGINILRNTPSILSTLQESVHPIWAVLNRVEAIRIPSHPASAVPSTSVSTKPPNPATTMPCETPSFDIPGEGRLLQGIVDVALVEGVWIHAPDGPPRYRASCIKAAVVKALMKRK
ncbi:hypothetical protein H4582DRAFT_2129181 [Lactarius indigo]|nr:hypothetical protein H4582DRAFT_2129181 [Lactarius indigo]